MSMKCSQSKHFFYRRLLFRQALMGIATCQYQFTDMPGESIKSRVGEE